MLAFFDPQPPYINIFYVINLNKRLKLLDYLPKWPKTSDVINGRSLNVVCEQPIKNQ